MTVSNNWQALLFLAWYAVPFVLFYYRREIGRRVRRAVRIRAWLRHLGALADRPFSPQLLAADEHRHVGRHGLTCDQWYAARAAEYVSLRRGSLPTCGDFVREFGGVPRLLRRELRARTQG